MDTYLIIAMVAAAALVSWLVSAHVAKKACRGAIDAERATSARVQGELEDHKQLLTQAQVEAGRLPDLLARAERAEALNREMQLANGDLLSKEASAVANLLGANSRIEELLLTVHTAGQLQAETKRELESSGQNAASAQASLVAIREQAQQFANERDQHAKDLAAAHVRLTELAAVEAKVRAERDAAVSSHEQTKAFLDEAQGRMRTVFIEAASKVFDEKSISLDQKIKESGEASRAEFEATIKPFSEQVGQFQQKVESFASDHARDFAKFEGSVGTIQKLNQEMADATNSLARALKGNAKTRGDWGEMILETVLKASGLVEGLNYDNQSRTIDEESGKQAVPDVVINFPDGRKIVVDAKVSLVAWTELGNAQNVAEQEDALIRHTSAMRQHVRDLANKNYPKILGSNALDMTIMFVPIEGALSAALSHNNDLQTEAMNKRIAFASPNTLMTMLRIAERLWTRDRLQKQVQTIADEAGKVLDALIDFMGEFEDIQKHLGRATTAFTTAKNRLHDSDRSVVKRAKRLVEAGAKGRKAIPESLQAIGDAPPIPLMLEIDAELEPTSTADE